MTPQLAETSGTMMVRPVTSFRSRESWKSNVELKYRADGPLKHTLADQFAYVERDVALVFNGA